MKPTYQQQQLLTLQPANASSMPLFLMLLEMLYFHAANIYSGQIYDHRNWRRWHDWQQHHQST